MEASLTGVYINQDNRVVFANQKYAEIYGYSREELIGMDPLALVHPQDRQLVGDIPRPAAEGR